MKSHCISNNAIRFVIREISLSHARHISANDPSHSSRDSQANIGKAAVGHQILFEMDETFWTSGKISNPGICLNWYSAIAIAGAVCLGLVLNSDVI